MVEEAKKRAGCYVKIESHEVTSTCTFITYTDSRKYIEMIAKDLPDMEWAYSVRDEPSVAKHVCRPIFYTNDT